jgi:imidazolonepropionase-like amidohydrolase
MSLQTASGKIGCAVTRARAGNRQHRVIRTVCAAGLFVLFGSDHIHGQFASDSQPAKATLAIVGGLLIDGHDGPPIYDGVVLVDGKTIVAVGTRSTLKVPAGVKLIDASGYTVMPGLIDAHVHVQHFGHADYDVFDPIVEPRIDEVMALSAKMLLMAGVTTALDMGAPPEPQFRIRDRIAKGELVGPRLKVSGPWICNMPDAQFAKFHRAAYELNVHTPEEARAAAQKTIAMGADFVKAFSGLNLEQLRAVVEEAHKKGLKVTGHSDNIMARLEAGQDWIEHRVPTEPEVLREVVRRRTAVTVTSLPQAIPAILTQEEPTYLDNPVFKASVPPDLYAFVRDSLSHINRTRYFGGAVKASRLQEQIDNIKKYYEAGVRLSLGTDSGASGTFHADCAWRTMDMMVRAGIPPIEVIGMATRVSAENIGMGSKLGTIAPGKLADIIVVDGNPLRSMRELNHILYVLKEGVQYKGPGTTIKLPALQDPATWTSTQKQNQDK